MTTNNMKKRLLYLMKRLYETTDENNQMTTHDLMDFLDSEGISTDRKTLRSDLRVMIECGYDIIVVNSKPNRYYWGSRSFEIPELKLLIDAVVSSRFITAKKSEELIKKLTLLASRGQQADLQCNVYVADHVKQNSQVVFYIIDRINDAINKQLRITFKYTEYTMEKKRVFKNKGEIYELSPYALYWNEDFYYVVGWSDKHGNVSAFRIDRMEEVEITEERAAPRPYNFNIRDYSRKIVKMFGGQIERVRLECDNDMMKYIIDRFGDDIKTEVKSEDKFVAETDVALSPTFYSWVFQFAGKIRITEPETAVDEMRDMAIRALK
jgi:predicted DNA-binding transcriptional regulator YafY